MLFSAAHALPVATTLVALVALIPTVTADSITITTFYDTEGYEAFEFTYVDTNGDSHQDNCDPRCPGDPTTVSCSDAAWTQNSDFYYCYEDGQATVINTDIGYEGQCYLQTSGEVMSCTLDAWAY